ncbi:MAG: sigma-E processing peptidase SpoIIGA [Bacilli bacterium]|nr:sigma-E processing peptidase SpoIIGA [Bacilli bacterium]
MKVYLDVLFITNFIFDFILLLSSSIILKRNIRIIRLILGALFGSLTIFILFIRFNTLSLLLFKLIISIGMVLISFGFNNKKYFIKNLYYLYLISIILGGLLTFINNNFSKVEGLVFYNSFKLNIFLGIILSIIGIYIYIKNIKDLKLNYNKYLNGIIYFNDYEIKVNAFVDTGNKLKDPYSFKPIILVDNKLIKKEYSPIYVPFKTCNNEGLLKCIKANKIYLDGIGYKKNFLVGITNSIKIDGVNCLLNEMILEG